MMRRLVCGRDLMAMSFRGFGRRMRNGVWLRGARGCSRIFLGRSATHETDHDNWGRVGGVDARDFVAAGECAGSGNRGGEISAASGLWRIYFGTRAWDFSSVGVGRKNFGEGGGIDSFFSPQGSETGSASIAGARAVCFALSSRRFAGGGI